MGVKLDGMTPEEFVYLCLGLTKIKVEAELEANGIVLTDRDWAIFEISAGTAIETVNSEFMHRDLIKDEKFTDG